MTRLILAAAAVMLALAMPAGAEAMRGSGPGCTDKALGAKLASLSDMDPEYITIWATGMANQSCRGYGPTDDVTVEKREDGIVCVRASNDATCFWVRAQIAP